jgi:hypothetical protein
MAGGLVQIAVYGTQDIFLTGTPQITFFKIVYRRYTNFAIESIQQQFFSDLNFDGESSCLIDKLGDLMHKVYLEIQLPTVNLLKNQAHWILNEAIAKTQFQQIQEYYQLVYQYISVNSDIARKLAILIRTNNIPMADIIVTMNDPTFIGELITLRENLQLYIAQSSVFDQITELRGQKLDLIQEVNQIDIQVLFNSTVAIINGAGVNNPQPINDLAIRTEVLRIITKMLYPAMKNFYMKAYNNYFEKQQIYQSFLDGTYVERYKFAWVEEIGHAITDQLDFKIGSQMIDRHTGDWMILFNKIFLNEYQHINYDKMIGNVPKLTDFNDKPKETYTLVIPLQFWFCRHTGTALPLVALRYHDIFFNLKLKDLSKLAYVEDDPNLLSMPNIQSNYNINLISAKLYVDYVFLDSDERRRFAQSTHEYLIEIVQYNEFNDILGKQYNAHLTFAHPTKYMIWFCQPKQYRDNPTGRNKCQWNNFGTRPNKTGYPIESEFIRLNSYERTAIDEDPKFFNYVQPYLYFNHSPTDGYNVYSFGIKPMELQPSGTCNMSRIDDLGLNMFFTDEFIRLVEQNLIEGICTGAYIAVYTVSYNILRIMSGMGGLAFQTST